LQELASELEEIISEDSYCLALCWIAISFVHCMICETVTVGSLTSIMLIKHMTTVDQSCLMSA